MSEPEPQLGRRIATPAVFEPNRQILTDAYLYMLDEARAICKRRPLHWDSVESVNYYELESSSNLAASKSKRFWRVAPATYRRLRFGIVATVVAAVIGLIYPLYPGLKYDITSRLNALGQASQAGAASQQIAVAPPSVSADNRLIIPKIGVTTKILEGSTLDILNHQEGVWHQTGVLQTGNFVLAGHRWRYLPPNSSTFYNLDRLEAGDVVIVDWNGRRYVYVINQKQTVPNTDLAVLDQAGGPRVTLYTCDDHGQTKRVVISAALQP